MLDSTFTSNQVLFDRCVGFEFSKEFFAGSPLSNCEISVTIPVRDEADNLNRTLEALTRQFDLFGKKVDPRCYEILVLANNCNDQSAAIVRQWQLKTTFPPIHLAEIELPFAEANCGRARQIVMNAAFARLKKLGKRNGVIATTDGDTEVAPDWIAATLAEIRRGADAVGGRIIVNSDELAGLDAHARRYHLRDAHYRLLIAELESYLAPVPFDPYPRHHQHFNASFAVTVEAFERAGGVPSVTHLEDFAFYKALLRIDARFRHSPKVRVYTSARRNGRTACGLSTQLSEWSNMGVRSESYLVQGADELQKQFVSSYALRQLWQSVQAGKTIDSKQIDLLAEVFGVQNSWLTLEVILSNAFGKLRQSIEEEQRDNQDWRVRHPLVPVEQAIIDLRLRLEKLRHQSKFAQKRPNSNFPLAVR